MIDWDAKVLGPLNAVFGEAVTYTPTGGAALTVNGVFDEAYTPVDVPGDMSAISAHPVFGARVSEFPIGWTAKNAQGDVLVRLPNPALGIVGGTYVVKAGKDDGHGHARLELMRGA